MGATTARDRVLVIGDALGARAQEARGSEVRLESVRDVEAARAVLAREPFALVLAELGPVSLELLGRLREEQPDTAFVLCGDAVSEAVEEALAAGAADVLCEPLSAARLGLVMDRVLAQRSVAVEQRRLRRVVETTESCRALVDCLDAGQIYAVALDLLLDGLARQRGVTFFRRAGYPAADGLVFRGFGEGESRTLSRLIALEKPVDPVTIGEIQVGTSADLDRVLTAARIESGRGLLVPMRGAEYEVGVAWVFEDGIPFGEDDLERAALIGGHANLALANAERYSRAKERAFVDDVTEVFNARYLLQATDHEIQRAERSGSELCVLFCDLDRFKQVNDRHGHLIGSQVLRKLSEVLGECIRQVDTLARYGGDEFTIVLVDTGHDGGVAVAERIRRTVAETIFEGGRDLPIRLTISIGVATYPLHARTRDALLDLADKAMYRAKSLGRNCVCSASELA
jgi:two-component system cell cycle response regulator